jgi:hypothetical protein
VCGDSGRRPASLLSAHRADEAITARLRPHLEASVPKVSPRARKEIERARLALDDLDAFTKDASCEDAVSGHMELSKPVWPPDFALVHDAAAALERPYEGN